MTPLRPLALCYHGIDNVPVRQDRSRLFVRPKDLQRHIRRLVGWGYQLVAFGELAARARDGAADGLAALTFDDGLVDNFAILAPLLSAEGVPGTVFVLSDRLGEPHPDAPWTRTMTENEIRAVSRSGLEVGGHSTRHDHLPDLDYAAAAKDMKSCRIRLEAIVDCPVSVFAYPYGGATEETQRACAAAGYQAACRCAGVGNWHEPFNLPRQDMQNRDSAIGLWLKRENRYEQIVQTRAGLTLRRASRLMRSLSP